MKSLEEIRVALQQVRLEVVAADTGLSFHTLSRYAKGKVSDPPMDSIQRISDWIENNEEKLVGSAR